MVAGRIKLVQDVFEKSIFFGIRSRKIKTGPVNWITSPDIVIRYLGSPMRHSGEARQWITFSLKLGYV
jgi:hypothetical protein